MGYRSNWKRRFGSTIAGEAIYLESLRKPSPYGWRNRRRKRGSRNPSPVIGK